MPVQVQCPNPECRASFSVSDADLGRQGYCLKCGQAFSLFSTRGTDASAASDVHPVWAPPRPNELAEGATFGRYRILRRLGRGGMGTVYLAHDLHLERDVALKIPHFAAAESPAVVQRFYREARALARFDHPNICPVYDSGQVDGVLFLTMPYLEGRPLAELVTEPPLSQRRAAEIVRTLARALAEAHDRGIIHRDLKPSNVLISPRRELVIVDFGLARRFEASDSRLTQAGTILGTPAYMAPEQVLGDIAAMGPGCDIYSLGVILYELLTGRLPFEGPASVVMGLVMVAEPPPPSAHRPDLDRQLEAICCKAMAKKVQDRYLSMSALAETLDEYLLDAQQAGPSPENRSKQIVEEILGVERDAQPAEPTPEKGGGWSDWPLDFNDQEQLVGLTPMPNAPVMASVPAPSDLAKSHDGWPTPTDRADIPAMASPWLSSPADDSGIPSAFWAAEIVTGSADPVSDNEASAIRRTYIGHEASIKSVGLLYYFGGAIGFIFLVLALVISAAPKPVLSDGSASLQFTRGGLIGTIVFYVAMTGFNCVLGYSLRKLQVWARWTVAGLLVPFLLVFCPIVGIMFAVALHLVIGVILFVIGEGICGYILYLMVSPKGSMVFSGPYQAIIAQTPHIRDRKRDWQSLLDTILLVVFAVLSISVGFLFLGVLLLASSR